MLVQGGGGRGGRGEEEEGEGEEGDEVWAAESRGVISFWDTIERKIIGEVKLERKWKEEERDGKREKEEEEEEGEGGVEVCVLRQIGGEVWAGTSEGSVVRIDVVTKEVVGWHKKHEYRITGIFEKGSTIWVTSLDRKISCWV